MSFRNNLIASYASQVYVTVIGIAIMPLYLSYMGAEAYGLVGFFTMLLTWFYLLDLGLTPTMAREMARFRGGATDALAYRRLVRALQVIFVTTAVVGGGVLLAFAGIIARDWLNVRHLPLGEVKLALQMIAAGVALRWMSGLYRGAVSGSEHLVWLGGYNAAIATLRFVGVVPVLILIGATPTIFFLYQLIIAALELVGLVLKTTQLLPPIETGEHVGWSLAPVREVFRFSLTIAFTSSVWVLVTQVDKLALSKLLPLADYGYFMLAILVASGVTIATLPISAALMPRMARVEAEGDQVSLIKLYRDATQLAATIGVPVAFTLAAFAEQVLWAWTGNPELARNGAPVLRLYALGNGIGAIAVFPYYLQYAKGNMRLHVIGNIVFLVLLAPSLVWATINYGAVGAGWAWLFSNMTYLLGWTPLVHRRFEPGLHHRWLGEDVAALSLVSGITAWGLSLVYHPSGSRVGVIAILLLIGLMTVAITAAASTTCRAYLGVLLRRRSLTASPEGIQ